MPQQVHDAQSNRLAPRINSLELCGLSNLGVPKRSDLSQVRSQDTEGPRRQASGSVPKRSRLARTRSVSVEVQQAEKVRVSPELEAPEPAADASQEDDGDARFQEVQNSASLQHDQKDVWASFKGHCKRRRRRQGVSERSWLFKQRGGSLVHCQVLGGCLSASACLAGQGKAGEAAHPRGDEQPADRAAQVRSGEAERAVRRPRLHKAVPRLPRRRAGAHGPQNSGVSAPPGPL